MRTLSPRQRRIYEIIFEAETPTGRAFDLILLTAIILSVFAVVLESVTAYREHFGSTFLIAEWVFTVIFSLEYLLRLYCIRNPWAYARSFFGIVDLLSIVPTYLSLIVPGTQSLLAIRALRLIRVFRIFKLGRFVGEADVLLRALKQSRYKIIVFFGTVMTIVLIMGTIMYLVEGPEHGYTSIPRSVYWAIVTLTTVGYGDITPKTNLGQALSSMVMILGYAIIAVPTGIVSVEIAQAAKQHANTICCPSCTKEGHDLDAVFCRFCGAKLKKVNPPY